MKSLIRFALTLLIGAILGYIFHNPIDTKLKAKFGAEKVETVRAGAEKGLRNGGEKGKVVINGAKEGIKEALDSTSTE